MTGEVIWGSIKLYLFSTVFACNTSMIRITLVMIFWDQGLQGTTEITNHTTTLYLVSMGQESTKEHDVQLLQNDFLLDTLLKQSNNRPPRSVESSIQV